MGVYIFDHRLEKTYREEYENGKIIDSIKIPIASKTNTGTIPIQMKWYLTRIVDKRWDRNAIPIDPKRTSTINCIRQQLTRQSINPIQ